MTVTLEQDRAHHALIQIKNLTNRPELWQGRYKSYVKGLPASILSNGLGQALATLLSASKEGSTDPHYVLYEHIEQWLCRSHSLASYPNAQNIMEAITSHDSTAYRVAQMEAMAYLVWLKKFAAAYLLGKEGDVN